MPILRLLVLFTASAALGLAQARPPKQPFIIEIDPAEQTLKVGTGIAVEIRFKNTSASPLSCDANISDLTGQDPNFTIDFRDEQGVRFERELTRIRSLPKDIPL